LRYRSLVPQKRSRQPQPGRPARRSSAKTALLTFLIATFVAGGVFFGCIFAATLADVLADDPAHPPIPIPNPLAAGQRPSAPQAAAPTSQPAPGQPTATPDPFAGVPAWQSGDRITILLLGLDMRDDERNQPTRSDTMILLTVDPVHKRAGMLSIPRDLWVPIPGHGENKINTAHFFGEADRTGGGPELAKKTVEYNFGVRVNYYARVDFHGFEQLLDALGGVTLDVERPVKDDEYPTEDYGIQRVYIPTGIQHLTGQEALRYARSRHSDNDFSRNHRQQAVLLAARSQILQPSVLPKVPTMIGILGQALKTDIPITEVLPLFNMARGIQSTDIVSRQIDSTMVIDQNGDGTVLIPDRKKIRQVVEEVFSNSAPAAQAASGPSNPPATQAPRAAEPATPTRPPLPTPTPTTPRSTATPTLAATAASVGVYNGTTVTGLAASTADKLRARGFTVKQVGNASRNDYGKTLIQDHTRGRSRAAYVIADILGVPSTAIQAAQPTAGGADVTVIIGQDYHSQ
jgi:LCP family protein required for cell wall assembly